MTHDQAEQATSKFFHEIETAREIETYFGTVLMLRLTVGRHDSHAIECFGKWYAGTMISTATYYTTTN